MANQVKITLTRSLIGRVEGQKATVAALGLKKIHQSVVKENNAAIQGMITKVAHLVTVEEI